MSPGVATEGVTPLCFPKKPGDLFSRQFCGVTPVYFFLKNWRPFFAHHCHFLLLSLGCNPLSRVSPRTFFICPTSFLHYSLKICPLHHLAQQVEKMPVDFETIRCKCRCTFLIRSSSCFVTGDKITELYSRQGLTCALSAFKRDLSGDTKQRKIGLARKWARDTMLLIRSVNVNVLHITTPRSRHEFTVGIAVIYTKYSSSSGITNIENKAFLYSNRQLPYTRPMRDCIQSIL